MNWEAIRAINSMNILSKALLGTILLTLPIAALTQDGNRARDLGIPFEGTTGKLNSITDVKGVEVGHVTLNYGDGELIRGTGPVRTGVTAIHPRGKSSTSPVFAGWFTLNASGEMTGTTWPGPPSAEPREFHFCASILSMGIVANLFCWITIKWNGRASSVKEKSG